MSYFRCNNVPSAIDISRNHHKHYEIWINDKATAKFIKQCLLAKKFSEAELDCEIGHGGWI